MRRYFLLLFFLPAMAAQAQIRMPQIFHDSMILQRDHPIPVWGWASKGERLTIRFNGKSTKTITGPDGEWKAVLPAMKAGGPFTMDIKGKSRVSIRDVLIGDVWFCSGQSNMVHQMGIHNVRYAQDIADAHYPEIRQFWIPTRTNLTGPSKELPDGSLNNWSSANPKDVNRFSAVAYFFALQIYKQQHVPIGIINASVGGTPIEAWISEQGYKSFPDILATIERNKDTTYVNGRNHPPAGSRVGRRPSVDNGLTGPVKWFDPSYVPKLWRTINVPGYWDDQGVRNLHGVVWYRREIDVPASMTGMPAMVYLGRIVDADDLYINGQLVGNTGYQYPQRRYAVSAGVFKPGKNLLVVRVTNMAGKGGFVPDKPYFIEAGGQTIDLKGYWQYRVGDVFRPGEGFGGFGGQNGPLVAQNQPAALYNAMVAPVVPFAIRGFLWYQGEANTGNPQRYADLTSALVGDWRNKWGEGELPFLYVQLPNFMDVNYLPENSNWALLREQQLKALSIPNTGMAVAIDAGEWNDIHPDDKKDVGDRLALLADKLTYGQKDLVASGPLYRSSEIEGNKIVIRFSDVGSGLVSHDGEELSQFAIAGEDKKFVWARAKIEGDSVVVWSDDIPQPKYVRYAWADNPFDPNLYNKEGLPASPFRTSDQD